MKKTLIIHIGYHKTGSSSIQYALRQYYKEITAKTNTKIVFEENFLPKKEINHSYIVKNIISTKNLKKKTIIINEISNYILNSKYEKFILTAKDFSFFEYYKKDLKLFNMLIKDKNIKIRYIIFIRKRDEMILSLAKQLKIKNIYFFYFLIKFKRYFFKDRYSPYTIDYKKFINNFSIITNSKPEVFFYDYINDVAKFFFYFIIGYKNKIVTNKRNRSYNLYPSRIERIIRRFENSFF